VVSIASLDVALSARCARLLWSTGGPVASLNGLSAVC